MALIKFLCECGNTDSRKATEYDGVCGYEAIVCQQCGSYSDHSGTYKADDWSLGLVGLKKKSPIKKNTVQCLYQTSNQAD